MTDRSSKKKSLSSSGLDTIQYVVLVHCHEISLKGHNRARFERLLIQNITQKLSFEFDELPPVKRFAGRVLVSLNSTQDAFQAAALIADVPGVVRVSVGLRLAQDLDLIYQKALDLALAEEPFDSFKVNARRANTDFPIDSMELNRSLGAWLNERLVDKKVQMHNPDLTIHLEMIGASAFLYTHTQTGIGGLPVGSGGKVVSLLSAGIDSPVASWRMLKRGAQVIGLHFSGRPETDSTSEYLVRQIAGRLDAYGGLHKLAVVPFGSYQREIASLVPAPLRVVFYRRLMFCVAEELAFQEGARALVTGESLGQVASQTLDNIRAIDAVANLPVLRPLIGMDKLEIIAQAERIGTFEISSQKHEDCCTLFTPKNPETHASLSKVDKTWASLPISHWLEGIMSEMEFVDLLRTNMNPYEQAYEPGVLA
ncbi:MAG: tRNA 4-thiouridine(8) synthase ThiI [Coriobacteriia bacterium]|nr:tRNA 4-thiouridine(8) synthase ThiI [Coriobacteriia bacterium]